MNSRGRNVRLTLLCAAAAGAIVALVAGCQTYDFEPVQPLAIAQRTQTKTIAARNLRPDLYLLVDRSLSMVDPVDPSASQCAEPDGGVCGEPPNSPCPADCPTRWTQMQSAMDGFLTNDGTVARMGLSYFPSDNFCGPTNAAAVDLNASDDDVTSMQGTADSIKTSLYSTNPQGGTPTGQSLGFVDTYYSTVNSANRQNFVLLLTDGLPNCNPNNANNYNNDPAACKCTLSNPSTCSAYPQIACLDESATVDSITQLATKGVKTIVVGFGADTQTGDAPAVLQAMASAGGFPKACPNGTDAECGTGDTCNTTSKLCNEAYYQATNATELANALSAISASISTGDPCLFSLDQAPSDPSLLSVLVNGTETPPGPDTWTYQASPAAAVVFQGQLCTDIKNSNSSNPYKIQVEVVQSL